MGKHECTEPQEASGKSGLHVFLDSPLWIFKEGSQQKIGGRLQQTSLNGKSLGKDRHR